jgi:hypothetical protein
MTGKQDSDLARIREVRIRISEECHNDPELLVKHYMEFQERYRDRLVYSNEAAALGQSETPLDQKRTERQ